ncbi:MAG: amidohydrolase, partial [Actinobacteria bacterium]|nr:amidohydrolase [Actinomycetota bacterium]
MERKQAATRRTADVGLIDCDVHIYGADEEILSHVDPAERDWFRLQGGAGLPGYPFGHPTGWFRHDSEYELGTRDGNSLEATQHQLLDAFGVDVGVLTASYGLAVSLMTSTYRAETFARAHNEWVREQWLDQEPRFRGSIVCPAQEPRAAAAEIRRMAEDDRFVQVLLIGGSERPYGDPRYLPIFEAASECGLPVAIHSGGEAVGVAAPPGGAGMPSFYIEWHTLGAAGSIMAHLVSLLCHGAFDRFPTLKVVLMEGGVAWLPGILWRLDTNWRALRSEIPWLERKPSEAVREHVKFTTQPLEHTDGHDKLLFEMLEAVGAPDILCFASDYPHWDSDDPAFMLGRLPEAWREPVMRSNAAA